MNRIRGLDVGPLEIGKDYKLEGHVSCFFEEMETGEGTLVVVLLLQPLIWD